MFRTATSVFLCGTSRPLLNWVAYALASENASGYRWTDVRLEGEVLDPQDPLGKGLIPPARFGTVLANEMGRSTPRTASPVGGLVREDEPPASVQRLKDFLRLPAHTQDMISRVPAGDVPVVLVLSNAHRMVALYPAGTVAPIVRSIVDSGTSVLVTFADTPPAARFSFDHIFHLEGTDPRAWSRATLTVEKGGSGAGPWRIGARTRLSELPGVDHILALQLGPPG